MFPVFVPLPTGALSRSSTSLAMPKSSTFVTSWSPSRVMKTLAGLMSRCTTPRSWAF